MDKRSLRWPASDVSRLEAFSDAVFAFAITLLVVSLEVPRTYDELVDTMQRFPAFGISFALLVLIWHAHYSFFRRYHLEDTVTIILNAALLFLVLFYIYPLKFLFAYLIEGLLGTAEGITLTEGQGRAVLMIYGAGWISVFLLFIALHLHAYQKRRQLELDRLEVFDAVTSIRENAIYLGVGLFSVSLVAIGGARVAFWAGMSYGLLGPLMGVHGYLRGRARGQLVLALDRPHDGTKNDQAI